MLQRVLRTVETHRMLEPGMRLGVAVSGGADSVCLLHVLMELASRFSLLLSVIHVDHGLRGEASQQDAAFVQALAERLKLPFHLEKVALAGGKGNLEQEARRARQTVFASQIRIGAIDRVATGHTRSDQAETVMLRLLRGAGPTGLAGILPIAPPGVIRPLLGIDSSEARAWLRERAICWREDTTNLDLSFDRNRLRWESLPALRVAYNPRLDEALSNLAELARGEEEYWAERIPRYRLVGGSVILKAAEVNSQPLAVARRMLRSVIEQVKGDLRKVEFTHIDSILELARSPQGRGAFQIPGLSVVRSFEWIRISPLQASPSLSDYQVPVSLPSAITLPGSYRTVDFVLRKRAEDGGCHDIVKNELDWKRLTQISGAVAESQGKATSSRLEIRNWRPGDHYRPLGESHGKHIKLLFQQHRIPVWERGCWPVLVFEDKILWSGQFGIAHEFAPGSACDVVLAITQHDTFDESVGQSQQ